MGAEYGVLTMELSPEMEKTIIELLDIEVEMSQAEVEVLPNNLKRFTVKIPEHKGGSVKDFILKMISNSPELNLN
jgi:hypothetical protein